MKKGYTIIELIVVLSIITIISSIAIINIGKVKERFDNIEFKNLETEIRSLLSFSKAYCRKNKVPGKIIVGSDRKTIKFEVTDISYPISKSIKLNDSMDIGSNFKISSDLKRNENNITDEGYIKSAGTIVLSNSKGKRIEITISVGNDIIRSYISDEEDSDIIQ